MDLTLIEPVHDERDNLGPLVGRVREVLGETLEWELLLVDDGSRDGSTECIRELARADERVRSVHFAERCGQTSAIAAGFRAARGELLATLDADLQNDPADLPAMIARLGDGDAVVGYRVGRQDDFLKRLSSRVANSIRDRLTGDHVRDTGCSLKLFRAEAIRSIPLFEGMHRFLPTLLRWHGFEVIEHPVTHHARVRGRSKYGVWNRAWRTWRDLLAVRWMRSRIIRPKILEETQ
jgi:glycosyltransferase involved in cell wall biosynthesis